FRHRAYRPHHRLRCLLQCRRCWRGAGRRRLRASLLPMSARWSMTRRIWTMSLKCF
ncbi:hypothetical protein GGF45_002940, partial [Coemansia sp. RSA 551]